MGVLAFALDGFDVSVLNELLIEDGIGVVQVVADVGGLGTEEEEQQELQLQDSGSA